MQLSDGSLFSGTATQLLAAVSGTLFAISDGMNYGWTAPMIPYLIRNGSHITTTKYEAEWLETDLMLGAFFGLPCTIYFVNKLGRKKSLLLSTSLSLVSWIMVAAANKMVYLHIARFSFGFAANMAFVAAPMYIAEIAESKIRGFLSSVVYLMMLMGFVIVYSVGPFMSFHATPIIGGIVLITELIFFPFMPESPYFYVYNNKPQLAKVSLKYFRPNGDVDEELKKISLAIQRQKEERGRIRDIFLVRSNRKALIIMTVLNAGQHFAAISVILMNLHIVLDSAGSIYIDSSIAAILFSVLMLIFATISSLNVDKYGRKSLLLISTISTSFCLLVLAIYFHLKLNNYDLTGVSWIPFASVMIYAATFKIGLGIVPSIITAEIFSSKVKALGMTISDAVYVVASIISIQLYILLKNSFGLYMPFYVFTAASFLIALYIYLYLPETKGKTLEEIQLLLKGSIGVPTIKVVKPLVEACPA